MKTRLFCRILQRTEEAVLVLLVGVMVVLSIAQIGLRNFFSVTLPWSDPLIRHLVLWSGFIGASIAVREDRQIRIDALLRFCSPSCRLLLHSFTALFSAAVCFALAWISVRFLQDERAVASRTIFDLPTWSLQLIFPLTFALMALRFFNLSRRTLLDLYRGRTA